MKFHFTMLICILCAYSFAQTTINGRVTDENMLPLGDASLSIVGGTEGAVSDSNGNFNLTTALQPPFFLRASFIGFEPLTVEVTANNQFIEFKLREGTPLDQIVISASRYPERIFESPVTIERLGLNDIRNTPSIDFYGSLENLKGVDVNINSLTFRSINTRGFSTFGNVRFLQLIDGMDNAVPAIDFSVGNLLGMVETDIESVELLPGPASALYGANAFNGILNMRTKNPFEYQGISAFYKIGFTSQSITGTNSYTDFGIRAAYKFSNTFAAKINFGYTRGTDWGADNTDGKPGTGLTRSSPGYDGINVYGDEIRANIKNVAQDMVNAGLLPPGTDNLVPSSVVSRTGYDEKDLTDYKAESVKSNWALHYRPWEDDFEIIYAGKVGLGSTIFRSSNRLAVNNLLAQQHKLEFRNDNFFLLGYLTSDNAGDSYDILFTGINLNNAWKDNQTWFGQYVGAFVQGTFSGLDEAQAHNLGRQTADTGRLEPGSPEFREAFNTIVSDPDLQNGSMFKDNSKISRINGNYNFSHLTDFANIQFGGTYIQREMNSSGTIYTDSDGPIYYSEYSMYSQIQKTFMEEDRLKFTGSVRYDKSDLFEGFLSPRIAIAYTAGKDEDHNLRFTFQTGFRSPSSQNLFFGIDLGRRILIGAARDNGDRYSRIYNVSAGGQDLGFAETITQTGRAAYTNSYLAQSVSNFAATGDPQQLEIGNPTPAVPEKIRSFEFGYRGKLNKTFVDLSLFYNHYEDFASSVMVIAPLYGVVGDNSLSVAALANNDFVTYQAFSNTEVDVNSYGGAIGISTKINNSFNLNGSYSFITQDFDRNRFPDFETNFNTPEHRVKLSFGNENLFKNFGFNFAWRWSDSFFWEAGFESSDIPAYHTIDAQINLRVPKIKSTLKIGAVNLLNHEYLTASGSGLVGSLYYVALTIL